MEEETKLLLFIVSRARNIEMDKIFRKSRKREIVLSRQIIQYFLKKHTGFSLEKIAKETGGLDHSLIPHTIKTINNLLEVRDEEVCGLYDCVNKSIAEYLVRDKIIIPYKIEKFIPIPTKMPANKIYPLEKMNVGDSFIGLTDFNKLKYKRLHSAVAKYGSRNDKRFTVRRTEDGVRVWRVK